MRLWVWKGGFFPEEELHLDQTAHMCQLIWVMLYALPCGTSNRFRSETMIQARKFRYLAYYSVNALQFAVIVLDALQNFVTHFLTIIDDAVMWQPCKVTIFFAIVKFIYSCPEIICTSQKKTFWGSLMCFKWPKLTSPSQKVLKQPCLFFYVFIAIFIYLIFFILGYIYLHYSGLWCYRVAVKSPHCVVDIFWSLRITELIWSILGKKMRINDVALLAKTRIAKIIPILSLCVFIDGRGHFVYLFIYFTSIYLQYRWW